MNTYKSIDIMYSNLLLIIVCKTGVTIVFLWKASISVQLLCSADLYPPV